MISRRKFLELFGAAMAGGIGVVGYAFGLEPLVRLRVTHNRLSPRQWHNGPPLRIAALADFHACEPWMNARRIKQVVDRANSLNADIIVLLGDYLSGMNLVFSSLPNSELAQALSRLNAPLGVHAILGNHDWWEDEAAQKRGKGPTAVGEALKAVGIAVYENHTVRLEKDRKGFWLAGLADQWALQPNKGLTRGKHVGLDDLDGTLAQINDDAPVILMAHEPDIFPRVPDHVALTLSGHTHGGQIRFGSYSPVVPSKFGNKYAYGHIQENGSDLLVSGGLGCSILPVRFGVPPEINLIELY
ncbi:metallophosphoesterase [uncultured Maritalea sp.]|uniref:metallophosphoesterase n=1 Tax=uncultured Maritalea sp. TaxID=757249 RepID=UPI002616159C|nr:metallophosphoesterase [uncultured Maritalea sp.]